MLVPDELGGFAQCNPPAQVFEEGGRLGDLLDEEAAMLVLRNEDVVRRLVVEHQKERSVLRSLIEKRHRLVGYYVGDVAFVKPRFRPLAGVAQQRIVIAPLTGQDGVAIKSGRFAAQMPLADHAGVVARPPELLRDRRLSAAERVPQRVDAVLVAVLAGEDHCAAGRADRIGDEGRVESDALGRQPIEIRGAVQAAAVCADRGSGVVVAHDEQDVRSSRGRTS